MKHNIINAAFLELGDMVEHWNIPSKEELFNASVGNEVDWDPTETISLRPPQSIASFSEQKQSIILCKDAIDSYCDINLQSKFTKSIIVRGHPGAGKTFCMLYAALYAISKGLNIVTTSQMAKRALQLGGKHWHKLLMLGTDHNQTPHRKSGIAIAKIERNAKMLNFLRSLHVLCGDEFGQQSAENMATYDIIFCHVRKSDIYMGGVLIIGTLDHLQIQPSNRERPFLLSNSILTCFKMIALQHSVRSTGDRYLEVQRLVCLDHTTFDQDPSLILKFRSLCSDIFTFVDNWNYPAIVPNTFRLYSKKLPTREALQDYQHRIRRIHSNNHSNMRTRRSIDVMKSRYSHEWIRANADISLLLDKLCKESATLIFTIGAIFECTFNDEGLHSYTQKAILFDLPSQDDLDQFKKIKVLLSPPGCKEVIYYPNATKRSYLDKGYVEINIGCCPDRI